VSIRRHIRTDLGFKAFPPTSANELSHNDLQMRQYACARFPEVFIIIPKHGDFIFTDECAIHYSSRNRNVYFWSKENSHVHKN
jgi:hypothetical protein